MCTADKSLLNIGVQSYAAHEVRFYRFIYKCVIGGEISIYQRRYELFEYL